MLSVNSNISSLNAQRNLERSTTALAKSLERLSSGLRINRAGDDAAGLAISESLRSQVSGLNQAIRNANDAVSLIGTGEGAIQAYTNIVQRIRELAVQAANDTNSVNNRAALQLEIDEQLQELSRIANTVQFNGLNLLDGSFVNKSIQVGAMPGQTIAISIDDMRAASLGAVAKTASGEVATLAAGDLVLNGTSIGASSSDGVSYAIRNGSAIAVAAAINAAEASTGVTATANATVLTVQGGSTTTAAVNGLSAGELTLNGQAIRATTAGDDTTSTFGNAQSAIAVAEAINDSTDTTGVAAAANAATKTFSLGTVSNANIDGVARILTIDGVGVTADLSGLAAGETSALALAAAINATVGLSGLVSASTDGSGHLVLTGAADGRNIDVETGGTAGTLGAELGFVAAGDLARTAYTGTVTLNSTVSDAVTVAGTAAGFTPGTYQNSGMSSVVLDGQTNSLVINGVNIGGVTVMDDDSSGALVEVINARSNQTGVVASVNSSNQLVLSAADGRNITLTTTGAAGEALGFTGAGGANLTDDTTAGTVTLYCSKAFSIDGTAPGFAPASVGMDYSTAITSIDVTSSAGAEDAIRTVDFALTQINETRSRLGALTNRLQITIDNLQIISENLAASDSRIRDADFAAETAILTKNQILQQAGVAILGQANVAPRAALQLLQQQ
ncbi:MAG: flagellin [Candidatus Sumerlaeota bacterium]|nr:flagellin [Candidatus Sumerlaeota bacterium]